MTHNMEKHEIRSLPQPHIKSRQSIFFSLSFQHGEITRGGEHRTIDLRSHKEVLAQSLEDERMDPCREARGLAHALTGLPAENEGLNSGEPRRTWGNGSRQREEIDDVVKDWLD